MLQVGSNGQWNDVPSTWQKGYVEEYGGLTGQVAFTENTSTDLATSVLLANDTDADGGTLTVTAVGAAAHGTVTLNGDVVSYNPNLDYSGADSFTYTISDGTYSSTGTVSFNVAAVPTLVWNTSSGDWTTSAGWSTNGIPTGIDDVTINAGSTPYTVTIADGETASAQTLTLDSTAATLVDAGLLTLTGDLAVDAGTFELQGGTLQALSITVASPATFSGYGTVTSPIAVTGTVEANGGVLDFTNYVTGTGTFDIATGATLKFDGIVSTGSVVSFTGNNGTLILGQSASFQGKVSGFSASGDLLDLGALNNGSTLAGDTFLTAASYNSASGTTLLTVTDQRQGASTFVNLVGDYSGAAWSVTSDGNGGVDVAEVPLPIMTVTPSPDHIFGSPNYGVVTVTVTVDGLNNQPLEGVPVQLSFTGGDSEGAINLFTYVLGETNPKTTDSDGTATFSFDPQQFAGTYTISALVNHVTTVSQQVVVEPLDAFGPRSSLTAVLDFAGPQETALLTLADKDIYRIPVRATRSAGPAPARSRRPPMPA